MALQEVAALKQVRQQHYCYTTVIAPCRHSDSSDLSSCDISAYSGQQTCTVCDLTRQHQLALVGMTTRSTTSLR
jgi:hypothetical protein